MPRRLPPPTLLPFPQVGPALSLKGQFGPAGALFDGWETRRHNPEAYDWAVIRLGPAAGAELTGFDIDTANFNGNEGPEAEVWGLQLPAEEEVNAVKEKDARVSVRSHDVCVCCRSLPSRPSPSGSSCCRACHSDPLRVTSLLWRRLVHA